MSASALRGARTMWALAAVAMILLVGLGVYFWLWGSSSAPIPDIPLDGQDKEVAEAITEARDALIAAPRSADAWGKLGRVLLANEIFPDTGFRCFQEAERLDPTNPRWPYFSAGYLLVDQGRPEEALPKLQRAVALTDGVAEAPPTPRLFLAEVLASLGKSQEAGALFEQVLAADSKNVRAHFGLGLLACSRADWSTARKHLESCLETPQARKKACIQLAVVCERLQDPASAVKYAKHAERLPNDGGWPDPYVAENILFAARQRDLYQQLEALEAQGQFVEAANILQRMVERDPEDYRPHLMMGRVLPRIPNLPRAEFHLLKARQLAPEKTQPHYLLGLVLYHKAENLAKSGQTAEAKKAFEESVKSSRQAISIQPEFGFAHMALGLALQGLGKKDDAITAFRQAVHCNPEFADNHLHLGQALAEAGKISEARDYLRQAQTLAPQDQRAKAALDKLPKVDPSKSKS